MTLLGLLSETAVVVRHGAAADEYGNLVRGTEARTTYPARLEQLATNEILRDRDTVVTDWRAFLPATADVTAYDRVEARGHVFEVSGLPDQHQTPRGPHHLEVLLRFVA